MFSDKAIFSLYQMDNTHNKSIGHMFYPVSTIEFRFRVIRIFFGFLDIVLVSGQNKF